MAHSFPWRRNRPSCSRRTRSQTRSSWFAGPDIVASVLLTGKVPAIDRAIRVVPDGKQAKLASTSLRGMVKVDAGTNSLFKHFVEQRAVHESDATLHYWLMILASSGSYGLFVELNPNKADATKLKVFSGEESFPTTSNVVEEPGKWFAPHIASLITSGGLENHIPWPCNCTPSL